MSVANIADILIEFSGFSDRELALGKFIVPVFEKCALRFILQQSSSSGFANHYDVRYFCAKDELFVNQNNGTYALVNDDNSQAIICTPDERKKSVSEITAAMMSVCLAKYDVLMAHAALVDLDGEGILFIGESGIGKTTQAELWQRYRDAVIINGDHVFIRKSEDGFWGYGSPWHGSSPYCENKKTKLQAIVALRQSPNNRIARLSGLDAILEAETACIFPNGVGKKWKKR